MDTWRNLSLIYAINEHENNIGVLAIFEKSLERLLLFSLLVIIDGFLILGSFYLFIIPGILFSISFIFAPYVFVSEREGPIQSLFKSFEYVRGLWWDVLLRELSFIGFMFLLVILFFILTFISPLLFLLLLILWFVILICVAFPLLTIYHYLLYTYVKSVNSHYSLPSGKPKYLLIAFASFIAILGYLWILFMFTNSTTRSFFAPPPNPSTRMKTYVSPGGTYEITYPRDSTLRTSESGGDPVFILPVRENNQIVGQMHIEVFEYQNEVYVKEFHRLYSLKNGSLDIPVEPSGNYGEFYDADARNEKVESIMLDYNPVVVLRDIRPIVGSDNTSYISYYLLNKYHNKVYRFLVKYSGKQTVLDYKPVTEMLKSFKTL